jgi:UDP-N-acetylmuramoyl-L-alanyl-D-glutamate--2,6-diaminopimelate ligase
MPDVMPDVQPASRPGVRLRAVLPEALLPDGVDPWVTSAAEHGDDCAPGGLFAVIRGHQLDGAQYLAQAVARGAGLVLTDRQLPDCPVPQAIVPQVRSAYARLCAQLAGDPTSTMSVAGVTGTNGKTTVTWMIRSLLQQAGHPTGVLGTVEYCDGGHSAPSPLTTPSAKTLNDWLARMVARGTTHAAIELSSHALHQDRVAGTRLSAAVVTNITQDHFDYHRTADAYRESKTRIIDYVVPGGIVVLNLDDPGSAGLQHRIPLNRKLVTTGLVPAADVSAQDLQASRQGTRFRLTVHGRWALCRTPLVGRHNVANCLSAAAVAAAAGVDLPTIVRGLGEFKGVPGRLERIEAGQPFDVYVDYAHTDDALRRCLTSLRPLTSGRLICVFGAGGDRDRSKRPLLGRAAQLADLPIVTSDNPRSEEPARIIDDILAGMEHPAAVTVEPDRAAAIRLAVAQARPGDCLLIAGKGHETVQIVGTVAHPFDDRAVAREALAAMTGPLRQSA